MDRGIIRKAFTATLVEELEYPEPSISHEMSIESERSTDLSTQGGCVKTSLDVSLASFEK